MPLNIQHKDNLEISDLKDIFERFLESTCICTFETIEPVTQLAQNFENINISITIPELNYMYIISHVPFLFPLFIYSVIHQIFLTNIFLEAYLKYCVVLYCIVLYCTFDFSYIPLTIFVVFLFRPILRVNINLYCSKGSQRN